MIPHLYHRSNATMNGIIPNGYADDAIMCEVNDTLNGALELEMEVPYTQRNIKWYEKETIVGVDIPDRAYISMNEKHQFFRIYDVEKDLSSMKIKMKAFHVSNLLAQLLIVASDRVLSGNITELWMPDSVTIEGGSVKSVEAEVGVSRHLRYERKNWLEAIMDEKDGVANKFGMDVIRHNHGIKLVKNRGVVEAQVRLHAEANIKNVNIQEKLTSPVIAILPYAKINVDQIKQREEQRKQKIEEEKKKGQHRTKAQIDADKRAKEAAKKAEDDARRAKKLAGDNGDRYIYGNIIKSPLFDNYKTGVILPVDFSGKDPDHKNQGKLEEDDDYFRVETVEAVNEVARNYYKWEEAKNIDKPSYEFSIDMIEQLPKDLYDSLRYLSLGDEITLVSHKYYMDINARVTKITWDILTGTKKTITGGTSRKTVYEEIRKSVENLKSDEKDKWVDEVNENLLKQFDAFANSVQDSADGKNTIYSGPDEPRGAFIEGDTWFKVMPDGKRDLYIWNGTEWSKVDFHGIAEEIERQFKESDDLWSKTVEPKLAELIKAKLPQGVEDFLKQNRTDWKPVNLLFPKESSKLVMTNNKAGLGNTTVLSPNGSAEFIVDQPQTTIKPENFKVDFDEVKEKYLADQHDAEVIGDSQNNFFSSTYILGSTNGSLISSNVFSLDKPIKGYFNFEYDGGMSRKYYFSISNGMRKVIVNLPDDAFTNPRLTRWSCELLINSIYKAKLNINYLYKVSAKYLLTVGSKTEGTYGDPYKDHPYKLGTVYPIDKYGRINLYESVNNDQYVKAEYSYFLNSRFKDNAKRNSGWFLKDLSGKLICFDVSYYLNGNASESAYAGNITYGIHIDFQYEDIPEKTIQIDRNKRVRTLIACPIPSFNGDRNFKVRIDVINVLNRERADISAGLVINNIYVIDINEVDKFLINPNRRDQQDQTVGQLMLQTGLIKASEIQEANVLGRMQKIADGTIKTSELKQDLDSISALVRDDLVGKVAQLRVDADSISKSISTLGSTYQTIATAQGEIKVVKDLIANTDKTNAQRHKSTETRITQLANSWSVKTLNSGGDIVSQININEGNLRIDGKLLTITANTIIDYGVIKTAMIGDAQITGAKIEKATINSAHIVSLDVGKISGSAAEFASGKFGQATINKIITDGIRMKGDRNSQGDAILRFSQGYMAVDFSNQAGLDSGWATLRVAGRLRSGFRLNAKNYQNPTSGIFGGVPIMSNAYEDDPIAHFDNNNHIWPISFMGLTQKNGVWYIIGEDGGNGREHRFWVEVHIANNQSFGSKKFPRSSYPNTNWMTIGL